MENVRVSQARKLHAPTIFKIGRVHIIKESYGQAELRHTACVGVTVNTKNALFKE
jgi:hypothetical protein